MDTKNVVELQSAVIEEIRKIEAARAKATISADIPALDGILSDDLTWIHASGNSDTKSQWMKKVESKIVKYLAITFDEVKYRVFNETVIINGKGSTSVFHHSAVDNFNMSFTAVYVKMDAGWKIVTMQVTKIS